MKITHWILVFSLFIFSCGKDKFNTKPKLTYKGVNAKTIAKNTDLKLSLVATDKEGDLTDSIYIFKINRNCIGKDTLRLFYKMPTYPTNSDLEIPISVNFTYGQGSQYPNLPIASSCNNRNDSCRFRFVIRDKAKNVSDTVDSEEIVLLK
jgi:hypothetical protein